LLPQRPFARGTGTGNWSGDVYDRRNLEASGYWRQVNVKGERFIWCQAGEEPSWFGVAVMGKPSPQIVLSLEGILKFPLFVGKTGTGLLAPLLFSSNKIAWLVKSRGF
jgi:hypothetical protein